MTGGIGNPDWQRRYTTSAVPIYTATLPDNAHFGSPVNDSNGYQYLLTAINIGLSTVYAHVEIDWFQDAGATVLIGITDWVMTPLSFSAMKVPVISRFYTFNVTPVGGAAGHNWAIAIYGTNADQRDLLTQNTAIPMAAQTIAAAAPGVTNTVNSASTLGGEAMITMDDNVNNKWTEWVEYYDWPSQKWIQFWTAHGLDRGQAWTERILLPHAPVRINCRNDDTVNHILKQFLVMP